MISSFHIFNLTKKNFVSFLMLLLSYTRFAYSSLRYLGQAACLPCSPGTYNNAFGSPSCPVCAMGQFTFGTKSTQCTTCQLGRGTIRNASAFCTPCSKGKYSGVNSTGTCVDCGHNYYQDKEEQSGCLNCPAGYLSGAGAVDCQKPALADPSKFPPPSPPTLVQVDKEKKEEEEEEEEEETKIMKITTMDSMQLGWEYPDNLEQPPDGFIVRMGTTRDFADEIIIPPIPGSKVRSTIVTIAPGINLWMLEQPVFMQVSAYLLGGGKDVYGDDILPVQSEWSTATVDWELAISCKDEEYLDTNATKPSEWRCVDCPKGASCTGPTVWADVRPLSGYWRVPWNHSVFERCPYIQDCIGYDITLRHFEQHNSSSDGCVLGTEGILCSQCSPGYNRDVATCQQCTPDSLPIRVAILVICLLLLYICLSACRRRLKTKWRKYRPLYRDVLRTGSIIVTFSQINTSMPTIIDIKWPPEFVNFVAQFNVVNIDVMSLIGVSCVGDFNFYIGFITMSCLPIIIFLWAMFDLWTAHKNMKMKVTHMSLSDKVLQEEEALHMLYHITDADGGGNINATELSQLLRQLGWNANAKKAYEIMAHFHDDGSKTWSNDTGQLVLTEDEFVASMIGSKMTNLLTEFKVLRVGARLSKDGTNTVIHSRQSRKETLLCDKDHLIRWILFKRIIAHSLAGATMLALLAHTPVSRKVFQFFHCNDIAGQFYLRADYTIQCWSLGWYAFSPVVLVVLGVFTVGLPGSISLYLYQHRLRLYSADVQQKIGWLYSPYVKGSEFWMIHDVIFKMILTGLLIYVPETARASVAAMISVFAVASLNYFIPHKNRILFWLTQLSFVVTTFKYLAALMLRVDHTKFNDGSEALIGWMLIAMDVTFMSVGLICVLAAIYVMKLKLNKYRRIKFRMKTLMKSASSMLGVEINAHKLETTKKNQQLKNLKNQGDQEEKYSNLKQWTVPPAPANPNPNSMTKVTPITQEDMDELTDLLPKDDDDAIDPAFSAKAQTQQTSMKRHDTEIML